MLQDQRPIKPLQHALCELLGQLGIEFLPSQWHIQETLLDPAQSSELALLRAYLNACNIHYQVYEQILPRKLNTLDPTPWS